MSITPKNWSEFQHYKDRSPVWIKLHRTLLDKYDFHCLPVASRALAPMLWLLASEYEDGKITASDAEIAFRLRMPEAELIEALAPLVRADFFISDNDVADCYQPASATLAPSKQVAILEREKETEVETEKEKDAAPSARNETPETELFDRGKKILGKNSGGLINQLLTAKQKNVAMARLALETAATKQDPREYIGAVIRGRDSPDDARSRGDAW